MSPWIIRRILHTEQCIMIKVWNTESPMVFAKQLAKVIGLLEGLCIEKY